MTAEALTIFATREQASGFAAEALGKALDEGLSSHGRAALLASGGSTPAATYRQLADQPRDWSRVRVGLVDERWVPPGDERSNERLLRRTLLAGEAAGASFVPMWTELPTPQDAREIVDHRYREAFPTPSDALLMGLGEDGHTASWFPRARGLEAALDPETSACVAAIDAAESPVAGDCPLRMTLTGAFVGRGRHVVLLAFGDRKRSVLDRALEGAAPELPVSALLSTVGAALTIVWSP